MKNIIYLNNIIELTKFLFGSLIFLIINLLLTYFLTKYFKIWYIYSYGIIQIIELIFLYFYHSLITFKVYGDFLKFFFVIMIIALINWLGVYLVTEAYNLNYLLAIVLVAGSLALLHYLIQKFFVFIK